MRRHIGSFGGPGCGVWIMANGNFEDESPLVPEPEQSFMEKVLSKVLNYAVGTGGAAQAQDTIEEHNKMIEDVEKELENQQNQYLVK